MPGDIYFILVLKSVRSWSFFVSLLLFSVIVFFILSGMYVKFLVIPIKFIRRNLERLIKDRHILQYEGSIISENGRPNFLKEVPSSGLSLYRNRETKKLEELLAFLTKIIMMKNTTAEGNFDYKDRAKIYEHFLGFLNFLEEKDYYHQCLLIIAYSKFKNNKFTESFDSLSDIVKSTEIEQHKILQKNDRLEHDLINIHGKK
jgi:hypothetical protein